MKSRLFNNFATTILLLGGGLVALTSLASCDNFLNAGQVKREIEESIAYNNAPASNVRLKSDDKQGEFLSDGEKSFKLGYNTSVQFTVKSEDYVFIGLEAVSNIDASQSRAEYVQFTALESDTKKGIYKYNVKLLKLANDILIRPVCQERPFVAALSPKLESSGCDQDSSIFITFNNQMDIQSFKNEQGKIDCLSITSLDGEDLSSYFGEPYFTEDNKTLCIEPLSLTDSSKLILKPDQTKSNLTIKVQYLFTNVKDKNGNTINASNVSGSHEYKINRNYGNPKIVTVRFEAADSLGKFVPAEPKECTVGYTFDLQFHVKKSDYKFLKLEAVSSDSVKQSREDCVSWEELEYDEETGLCKTRVRILQKKDDILIRPVCLLIPKVNVNSISPALESNGCNQDSTITIPFNKEMNPSSFMDADGKISGVSITSSDGEDLTSYFGDPIFVSESETNTNNKLLRIQPLCLTDDTKFILSPDGTRNVLNIKVSYAFVNVKDQDGISFTASGSHEYRINKKFTEQKDVNVRIQNENAEYGSFLAAGDKDCIVGFSFDVQFTLKKDTYIFKGFEAVGKDGITSRAECVSFENVNYDEESGICSATVTIIQNNNDIVIRPKCQMIANKDIYIDGTNGKLSPGRGLQEKRIYNREYNISFDPDSDYEFLYWQIFDKSPSANGQQIPNGTYITITDPSKEETNYKLSTLPDDESIQLALRPVVAERPQILSYSPLLNDEGVNKDTTIQVVFDYDMSENSIYYTKPELVALKEDFGESSLLPPVTINGENKYYGYKIKQKNSDEYDYFYKNILLKDNDTGENLNKYFNPPRFDNKRTLSIFAIKDENSKSPLNDYSQIIVTLEKDFFYKKDNMTDKGKEVCMAGSKKWIYMVNDSIDKDAPLIANETDVKVELMNTIVNSQDKGTVEIVASESAPSTASKAPVAGLQYIKNKKIKLNIKSTDTGSGTSPSFGIVLQKIYDGDYNKVTEDFIDSKTVKYKKVTKTNGIYSDENGIDLGSLFDLQDGIYKMTFEFKDRGGNTLSYPDGKAYYFAVDKTAPDVPAPLMASSSSNSTDYTVYWDDYYDLNLAQVSYGEAGETMTVSESIEKGTNSSTVNGIYSQKIYEVKVKFTDYAGNEVEKTVPKFLTGFALSGMPTFTGTNASHADNVFLTTDKIGFYDITATAYYSDGSTADVTSDFSIPDRSSYNSSWTPSFTYEEENEKGKISKKASITTGTYFIAKKDALTQVPEFYQADGWWYCKFGDYPQNVSTISSYTTNPVYNGWFIGSDGYFYELCTSWVATNEGNGNMMSNGQRMANNTQYCFRVQPIEWRFASGDYNGKRLLIAKRNLDRSVYYTSTSTRSVNGNTVNPNDYKYSTLRAFLNGKYESGDPQSKTYQGSGFLQRAFTSSAQALIFEGDVDNSARSTNTQRNANEWSSGNNVFAYGSTKDKVFVLSVQEATNESYGFNKDPTWKEYGMRLVRTTDYAKAKHVFQSKWTDGHFESNWWLRSPRDINSTQSRIVGGNATIVHDVSVNNDTVGIVPAIVLN